MIFLGKNNFAQTKKVAVISTDSNDMYFFFMPITSYLWTQMGYQPFCFVVGDNNSLLHKMVIEETVKMGGQIGMLTNDMMNAHGILRGYNASLISQISRLCICSLREYEDDTTFIVGDIDMFPLNKTYFNTYNQNSVFTIFHGNAYDHTRYPMCYLCGKKNIWRDIMGIDQTSIYGCLKFNILSYLRMRSDTSTQRNFDEIFFFKRIKHWNKYGLVEFLNRNIIVNPGFNNLPSEIGLVPNFSPSDRLERSYWVIPDNISTYVDAHCPRPGFSEENWNKILALLSLFVSKEILNWAVEYKNNFVNLLNRGL
jgi:hypothetical protein